jgi:5,10-methylenetetrahydromethanopterin reductase
MRIGLSSSHGGLNGTIEEIVRTERLGFASFGMAQVFGRLGLYGSDPLVTFAAAAALTRQIEMIATVVPIFAHHPIGLAQMVGATAWAADGRFALGIGVGHKPWIEAQLGIPFTQPVARLREYLSVLRPLVDGDEVAFNGDFYSVHAQLSDTGYPRVSVLVAALGPQMLRAAAELSDGTILAHASAGLVADYVLPTWRAGAPHGREPRILLNVAVALTNDREATRATFNERASYMATLPSYAAMLERSGAQTPADVALIGDEAELARGLRALEEAGVTDLFTGGTDDQTVAFLAAYASGKC